MAGLLKYLNACFRIFGKNGLIWFKRWSELNPENQVLGASININEETFEIIVQNPLAQEQIDKFKKDFDEFIRAEGPQIYGKLLFKKKLEELSTELK